MLDAIYARGGNPEWTGEQWLDTRQRPHAKALVPVRLSTQPAASARPPARSVQRYIPPAPKSTFAIGGKPGTGRAIEGYDPAFAPHEASAVRWQVNVVTMLNEMATRIDAQDRRADEQERRIKAMEPRPPTGRRCPARWACSLTRRCGSKA